MRTLILSLIFALATTSCEPTDPESPSASGGSDARSSFETRIRSQVDHRPSPWVFAHYYLAFPKEFTDDGVAKLRRFTEARDGGGIGFPLQRMSGGLGEQHPHLVLKTLTEIALDDPAARQLIDELAMTAARTVGLPSDPVGLDDLAWYLEAIARLGADPEKPIRANGPTPRQLANVALEAVIAGDRVVEEALAREKFERPGGGSEEGANGTYRYTCGGQHLLQAVLIAAERGLLTDEDRDRVAQRVAIYMRRLDAEYRFRQDEYGRAVASGQSERGARLMFAVLSMKLLGHGLEILARAHRYGIGDRAAIEESIRSSRSKLLGIFRSLDEDLDPDRTWFESLQQRPHLWELWFGDGCHALHGLEETDPIVGGQ